MHGKDEVRKKYISLFISILIVCGGFLPWLVYEGRTYSLYSFFKEVWTAGGITAYIPDGGEIYISYVVLYLALFTAILAGVRVILLLLNRKSRLVSGAIRWFEFLYIMGIFWVHGYELHWGIPVVGALVVTDFLASLFLEQKEEIYEQYFLLKKREREEKAERKRRLSFPGKYPGEFRKIIRENFFYNWKNYVLFILSGVLSAAFLTVVFGTYNMLQKQHSEEAFIFGAGMQQIMLEAMALIAAITVFLMAFVFSYYIKSRMPDYQKYTVLGIRSKTLSEMMAAEYAGSLIIAFGIGILLGTALQLGVCTLIEQKMGGQGKMAAFHPSVYLAVLGAYILVILLATMINYESYLQARASYGTVQTVANEKIPGAYPLLWALFGLFWMWRAVRFYGSLQFAEGMLWIAVYLAGLYLLLVRGAAFLIKIEKKREDHYYRHLLEKIPTYHHFKKSYRSLFLLTVIHFMVLGVYLFRLTGVLTAAPAEDLCPYDYVCMAHEGDEDILRDIDGKYASEVKEYPMFRVTSAESDVLGAMGTFLSYAPRGQHVGISESTYRELMKEVSGKLPASLGLKEGEIHVVFQHDNSAKPRLLDSTEGNEEVPSLKIGAPHSPRDFSSWKIKSKETAILTGMLQRGAHENLVVFSDDYFDSAYSAVTAMAESEETKLLEGPTKLYLVQSTGEYREKIERALEKLAARHPEDREYDGDIRVYYEKAQITEDTIAERYTKEILYAGVILMLMTCGIFLSYIRFSFEEKELRRRYEFLDCMGMQEKAQRKTIRRELWPYAVIPLILSVASAGVFAVITFDLRDYRTPQIQNNLKVGGALGAVYCLVQVLWIGWLVHRTIRNVEKDRREKKRPEDQNE